MHNCVIKIIFLFLIKGYTYRLDGYYRKIDSEGNIFECIFFYYILNWIVLFLLLRFLIFKRGIL